MPPAGVLNQKQLQKKGLQNKWSCSPGNNLKSKVTCSFTRTCFRLWLLSSRAMYKYKKVKLKKGLL